MSDLFGSPEMAAGYARSRPAVHPHVIEMARARLGQGSPAGLALDVGCGAGVSTVPLSKLTRFSVGIEPAHAMVSGTPLRSDQRAFVVGRAEALPVRAHSVDLLTAAGSLNYVELDVFFAEASRVLRIDGALMVYDFSAGRSFGASTELEEWFDEFLLRYPRAAGAARPLDPALLTRAARGFRLVGSERFVVGLDLDQRAYRDYVMTETNVAHAIGQGKDVRAIRDWCSTTLSEVFGAGSREVQFPGYLAHLAPLPS
jgi:SAM-dependent methyltransferase